jgi:UDP-N-acetylmuramoyl-L-alanyl-D-glutamate--2,6-diaminopimelate ligase
MTYQKPLGQLLQAIGVRPFSPHNDVVITGIALDSRRVRPGNLFVALAGRHQDGHQFIPDALDRGVKAVIGSQPGIDLQIPYYQVGDGRRALAQLSAAFYDFPARRLTMIGVTGTDGKTTTTNLIYHILREAGIQAGMITTVNAVIGDDIIDTGFHVTTPEAPDVQRYLAQMVSAGLTHVVLEVTSHGLEQQRVGACEFDIAVVTNITHEHLDYHGTYAGYRAAKARLFTGLASTQPKKHDPPRFAILNRDDSSYEYLSERVSVPVITYGLGENAYVRAFDIHHSASGLNFTVSSGDTHFPIKSRLIGEYNVYNCLGAVAVSLRALGLPAQTVRSGVASLESIPGRMEVINLSQDFLAVVDFAHTPNALEEALKTARTLTPGRVIAVFGSAGLRDRAKRRMMAEASAQLSDLTVLTAEDPRTESLTDILSEMAAGVEALGGVEGRTFWRVPDRGEAIRFGLTLARPGDVVIVCGKGHEQSMCFGTTEYAWDDRQAMRAALAEYLNIPGPEMPYLPTQEDS